MVEAQQELQLLVCDVELEAKRLSEDGHNLGTMCETHADDFVRWIKEHQHWLIAQEVRDPAPCVRILNGSPLRQLLSQSPAAARFAEPLG